MLSRYPDARQKSMKMFLMSDLSASFLKVCFFLLFPFVFAVTHKTVVILFIKYWYLFRNFFMLLKSCIFQE